MMAKRLILMAVAAFGLLNPRVADAIVCELWDTACQAEYNVLGSAACDDSYQECTDPRAGSTYCAVLNSNGSITVKHKKENCCSYLAGDENPYGGTPPGYKECPADENMVGYGESCLGVSGKTYWQFCGCGYGFVDVSSGSLYSTGEKKTEDDAGHTIPFDLRCDLVGDKTPTPDTTCLFAKCKSDRRFFFQRDTNSETNGEHCLYRLQTGCGGFGCWQLYDCNNNQDYYRNADIYLDDNPLRGTGNGVGGSDRNFLEYDSVDVWSNERTDTTDKVWVDEGPQGYRHPVAINTKILDYNLSGYQTEDYNLTDRIACAYEHTGSQDDMSGLSCNGVPNYCYKWKSDSPCNNERGWYHTMENSNRLYWNGFDQDIDTYLIWKHVVELDTTGSGYKTGYAIKAQNYSGAIGEAFDLDDDYRALRNAFIVETEKGSNTNLYNCFDGECKGALARNRAAGCIYIKKNCHTGDTRGECYKRIGCAEDAKFYASFVNAATTILVNGAYTSLPSATYFGVGGTENDNTLYISATNGSIDKDADGQIKDEDGHELLGSYLTGYRPAYWRDLYVKWDRPEILAKDNEGNEIPGSRAFNLSPSQIDRYVQPACIYEINACSDTKNGGIYGGGCYRKVGCDTDNGFRAVDNPQEFELGWAPWFRDLRPACNDLTRCYKATACDLTVGAYSSSPNTSFFSVIDSHSQPDTIWDVHCYRARECHFDVGAYSSTPNTSFFSVIYSLATGSTCYRGESCGFDVGAYSSSPNTSFFITNMSIASGSDCYRGERCQFEVGVYSSEPNTSFFSVIQSKASGSTCYRGTECDLTVGAYTSSPNTSFFNVINSLATGSECFRGQECQFSAGAYSSSPNTSFFKTINSLASGSTCYRGTECDLEVGAYTSSPNTVFFVTNISKASGSECYRSEKCEETASDIPDTSFFLTVDSKASGSTCYRSTACNLEDGAYTSSPNTSFFNVIVSTKAKLDSTCYRGFACEFTAGAYSSEPNTSFFKTIYSLASGSTCYRGTECDLEMGAYTSAPNTSFFAEVKSMASGSDCYRGDLCNLEAGAYSSEPNTFFFVTQYSLASLSRCYRGIACDLSAGAYTSMPSTVFFEHYTSLASGSTCYRGKECAKTANKDPNTSYFLTVSSEATSITCYRSSACNLEAGAYSVQPNIEYFTDNHMQMAESDSTCYRGTSCNLERGAYSSEPNTTFFEVGVSLASGSTCYRGLGCTEHSLAEGELETAVDTSFFVAESSSASGSICYRVTDCHYEVGAYSSEPNTSFFNFASKTMVYDKNGTRYEESTCYRGTSCHLEAGAYTSKPNTAFFAEVKSMASGSECYRGDLCASSAGAYSSEPNTWFFKTQTSVASDNICYRGTACADTAVTPEEQPTKINTSFFKLSVSGASGSVCYRTDECHIPYGAYSSAPNEKFFFTGASTYNREESMGGAFSCYRGLACQLFPQEHEQRLGVTEDEIRELQQQKKTAEIMWSKPESAKDEFINQDFFIQSVSQASGSRCYRGDKCAAAAYTSSPNTSFFNTVSSTQYTATSRAGIFGGYNKIPLSTCYRGTSCAPGALQDSEGREELINSSYFEITISKASGLTCYRGDSCNLKGGAYTSSPNTSFFITGMSVYNREQGLGETTCYRGQECAPDAVSGTTAAEDAQRKIIINSSYFEITMSKASGSTCYRGDNCNFKDGAYSSTPNTSFFIVGMSTYNGSDCYRGMLCNTGNGIYSSQPNTSFFGIHVSLASGFACYRSTACDVNKKSYPYFGVGEPEDVADQDAINKETRITQPVDTSFFVVSKSTSTGITCFRLDKCRLEVGAYSVVPNTSFFANSSQTSPKPTTCYRSTACSTANGGAVNGTTEADIENVNILINTSFFIQTKSTSSGSTCYRGDKCDLSVGSYSAKPNTSYFNIVESTKNTTCYRATSCNTGDCAYDDDHVGEVNTSFFNVTSLSASGSTCYRGDTCAIKVGAYSSEPNTSFFSTDVSTGCGGKPVCYRGTKCNPSERTMSGTTDAERANVDTVINTSFFKQTMSQASGSSCYRGDTCNLAAGAYNDEPNTSYFKTVHSQFSINTIDSTTCYRATACALDKGAYSSIPNTVFFAISSAKASSIECFRAERCNSPHAEDNIPNTSYFNVVSSTATEITCYRASSCNLLVGAYSTKPNSSFFKISEDKKYGRIVGSVDMRITCYRATACHDQSVDGTVNRNEVNRLINTSFFIQTYSTQSGSTCYRGDSCAEGAFSESDKPNANYFNVVSSTSPSNKTCYRANGCIGDGNNPNTCLFTVTTATTTGDSGSLSCPYATDNNGGDLCYRYGQYDGNIFTETSSATPSFYTDITESGRIYAPYPNGCNSSNNWYPNKNSANCHFNIASEGTSVSQVCGFDVPETITCYAIIDSPNTSYYDRNKNFKIKELGTFTPSITVSNNQWKCIFDSISVTDYTGRSCTSGEPNPISIEYPTTCNDDEGWYSSSSSNLTYFNTRKYELTTGAGENCTGNPTCYQARSAKCSSSPDATFFTSTSVTIPGSWYSICPNGRTVTGYYATGCNADKGSYPTYRWWNGRKYVRYEDHFTYTSGTGVADSSYFTFSSKTSTCGDGESCIRLTGCGENTCTRTPNTAYFNVAVANTEKARAEDGEEREIYYYDESLRNLSCYRAIGCAADHEINCNTDYFMVNEITDVTKTSCTEDGTELSCLNDAIIDKATGCRLTADDRCNGSEKNVVEGTICYNYKTDFDYAKYYIWGEPQTCGATTRKKPVGCNSEKYSFVPLSTDAKLVSYATINDGLNAQTLIDTYGAEYYKDVFVERFEGSRCDYDCVNICSCNSANGWFDNEDDARSAGGSAQPHTSSLKKSISLQGTKGIKLAATGDGVTVPTGNLISVTSDRFGTTCYKAETGQCYFRDMSVTDIDNFNTKLERKSSSGSSYWQGQITYNFDRNMPFDNREVTFIGEVVLKFETTIKVEEEDKDVTSIVRCPYTAHFIVPKGEGNSSKTITVNTGTSADTNINFLNCANTIEPDNLGANELDALHFPSDAALINEYAGYTYGSGLTAKHYVVESITFENNSDPCDTGFKCSDLGYYASPLSNKPCEAVTGGEIPEGTTCYQCSEGCPNSGEKFFEDNISSSEGYFFIDCNPYKDGYCCSASCNENKGYFSSCSNLESTWAYGGWSNINFPGLNCIGCDPCPDGYYTSVTSECYDTSSTSGNRTCYKDSCTEDQQCVDGDCNDTQCPDGYFSDSVPNDTYFDISASDATTSSIPSGTFTCYQGVCKYSIESGKIGSGDDIAFEVTGSDTYHDATCYTYGCKEGYDKKNGTVGSSTTCANITSDPEALGDCSRKLGYCCCRERCSCPPGYYKHYDDATGNKATCKDTKYFEMDDAASCDDITCHKAECYDVQNSIVFKAKDTDQKTCYLWSGDTRSTSEGVVTCPSFECNTDNGYMDITGTTGTPSECASKPITHASGVKCCRQRPQHIKYFIEFEDAGVKAFANDDYAKGVADYAQKLKMTDYYISVGEISGNEAPDDSDKMYIFTGSGAGIVAIGTLPGGHGNPTKSKEFEIKGVTANGYRLYVQPDITHEYSDSYISISGFRSRSGELPYLNRARDGQYGTTNSPQYCIYDTEFYEGTLPGSTITTKAPTCALTSCIAVAQKPIGSDEHATATEDYYGYKITSSSIPGQSPLAQISGNNISNTIALTIVHMPTQYEFTQTLTIDCAAYSEVVKEHCEGTGYFTDSELTEDELVYYTLIGTSPSVPGIENHNPFTCYNIDCKYKPAATGKPEAFIATSTTGTTGTPETLGDLTCSLYGCDASHGYYQTTDGINADDDRLCESAPVAIDATDENSLKCCKAMKKPDAVEFFADFEAVNPVDETYRHAQLVKIKEFKLYSNYQNENNKGTEHAFDGLVEEYNSDNHVERGCDYPDDNNCYNTIGNYAFDFGDTFIFPTINNMPLTSTSSSNFFKTVDPKREEGQMMYEYLDGNFTRYGTDTIDREFCLISEEYTNQVCKMTDCEATVAYNQITLYRITEDNDGVKQLDRWHPVNINLKAVLCTADDNAEVQGDPICPGGYYYYASTTGNTTHPFDTEVFKSTSEYTARSIPNKYWCYKPECSYPSDGGILFRPDDNSYVIFTGWQSKQEYEDNTTNPDITKLCNKWKCNESSTYSASDGTIRHIITPTGTNDNRCATGEYRTHPEQTSLACCGRKTCEEYTQSFPDKFYSTGATVENKVCVSMPTTAYELPEAGFNNCHQCNACAEGYTFCGTGVVGNQFTGDCDTRTAEQKTQNIIQYTTNKAIFSDTAPTNGHCYKYTCADGYTFTSYSGDAHYGDTSGVYKSYKLNDNFYCYKVAKPCPDDYFFVAMDEAVEGARKLATGSINDAADHTANPFLYYNHNIYTDESVASYFYVSEFAKPVGDRADQGMCLKVDCNVVPKNVEVGYNVINKGAHTGIGCTQSMKYIEFGEDGTETEKTLTCSMQVPTFVDVSIYAPFSYESGRYSAELVGGTYPINDAPGDSLNYYRVRKVSIVDGATIDTYNNQVLIPRCVITLNNGYGDYPGECIGEYDVTGTYQVEFADAPGLINVKTENLYYGSNIQDHDNGKWMFTTDVYPKSYEDRYKEVRLAFHYGKNYLNKEGNGDFSDDEELGTMIFTKDNPSHTYKTTFDHEWSYPHYDNFNCTVDVPWTASGIIDAPAPTCEYYGYYTSSTCNGECGDGSTCSGPFTPEGTTLDCYKCDGCTFFISNTRYESGHLKFDVRRGGTSAKITTETDVFGTTSSYYEKHFSLIFTGSSVTEVGVGSNWDSDWRDLLVDISDCGTNISCLPRYATLSTPYNTDAHVALHGTDWLSEPIYINDAGARVDAFRDTEWGIISSSSTESEIGAVLGRCNEAQEEGDFCYIWVNSSGDKDVFGTFSHDWSDNTGPATVSAELFPSLSSEGSFNTDNHSYCGHVIKNDTGCNIVFENPDPRCETSEITCESLSKCGGTTGYTCTSVTAEDLAGYEGYYTCDTTKPNCGADTSEYDIWTAPYYKDRTTATINNECLANPSAENCLHCYIRKPRNICYFRNVAATDGSRLQLNIQRRGDVRVSLTGGSANLGQGADIYCKMNNLGDITRCITVIFQRFGVNSYGEINTNNGELCYFVSTSVSDIIAMSSEFSCPDATSTFPFSCQFNNCGGTPCPDNGCYATIYMMTPVYTNQYITETVVTVVGQQWIGSSETYDDKIVFSFNSLGVPDGTDVELYGNLILQDSVNYQTHVNVNIPFTAHFKFYNEPASGNGVLTRIGETTKYRVRLPIYTETPPDGVESYAQFFGLENYGGYISPVYDVYGSQKTDLYWYSGNNDAQRYEFHSINPVEDITDDVCECTDFRCSSATYTPDAEHTGYVGYFDDAAGHSGYTGWQYVNVPHTNSEKRAKGITCGCWIATPKQCSDYTCRGTSCATGCGTECRGYYDSTSDSGYNYYEKSLASGTGTITCYAREEKAQETCESLGHYTSSTCNGACGDGSTCTGPFTPAGKTFTCYKCEESTCPEGYISYTSTSSFDNNVYTYEQHSSKPNCYKLSCKGTDTFEHPLANTSSIPTELTWNRSSSNVEHARNYTHTGTTHSSKYLHKAWNEFSLPTYSSITRYKDSKPLNSTDTPVSTTDSVAKENNFYCYASKWPTHIVFDVVAHDSGLGGSNSNYVLDVSDVKLYRGTTDVSDRFSVNETFINVDTIGHSPDDYFASLMYFADLNVGGTQMVGGYTSVQAISTKNNGNVRNLEKTRPSADTLNYHSSVTENMKSSIIDYNHNAAVTLNAGQDIWFNSRIDAANPANDGTFTSNVRVYIADAITFRDNTTGEISNGYNIVSDNNASTGSVIADVKLTTEGSESKPTVMLDFTACDVSDALSVLDIYNVHDRINIVIMDSGLNQTYEPSMVDPLNNLIIESNDTTALLWLKPIEDISEGEYYITNYTKNLKYQNNDKEYYTVDYIEVYEDPFGTPIQTLKYTNERLAQIENRMYMEATIDELESYPITFENGKYYRIRPVCKTAEQNDNSLCINFNYDCGGEACSESNISALGLTLSPAEEYGMVENESQRIAHKRYCFNFEEGENFGHITWEINGKGALDNWRSYLPITDDIDDSSWGTEIHYVKDDADKTELDTWEFGFGELSVGETVILATETRDGGETFEDWHNDKFVNGEITYTIASGETPLYFRLRCAHVDTIEEWSDTPDAVAIASKCVRAGSVKYKYSPTASDETAMYIMDRDEANELLASIDGESPLADDEILYATDEPVVGGGSVYLTPIPATYNPNADESSSDTLQSTVLSGGYVPGLPADYPECYNERTMLYNATLAGVDGDNRLDGDDEFFEKITADTAVDYGHYYYRHKYYRANYNIIGGVNESCLYSTDNIRRKSGVLLASATLYPLIAVHKQCEYKLEDHTNTPEFKDYFNRDTDTISVSSVNEIIGNGRAQFYCHDSPASWVYPLFSAAGNDHTSMSPMAVTVSYYNYYDGSLPGIWQKCTAHTSFSCTSEVMVRSTYKVNNEDVTSENGIIKDDYVYLLPKYVKCEPQPFELDNYYTGDCSQGDNMYGF